MNTEHKQIMTTTQELQQKLQENGGSLYDFAVSHEYKYRTVCTVAQRWWHRRNESQPHGGLSREILSKLIAYAHSKGCRNFSDEVATKVATEETMSQLLSD